MVNREGGYQSTHVDRRGRASVCSCGQYEGPNSVRPAPETPRKKLEAVHGPLMSAADVGRAMGVIPGLVRHWVAKGWLPYVEQDGVRYYKESDIPGLVRHMRDELNKPNTRRTGKPQLNATYARNVHWLDEG